MLITLIAESRGSRAGPRRRAALQQRQGKKLRAQSLGAERSMKKGIVPAPSPAAGTCRSEECRAASLVPINAKAQSSPFPLPLLQLLPLHPLAPPHYPGLAFAGINSISRTILMAYNSHRQTSKSPPPVLTRDEFRDCFSS